MAAGILLGKVENMSGEGVICDGLLKIRCMVDRITCHEHLVVLIKDSYLAVIQYWFYAERFARTFSLLSG